jgi:hypothetical protein
MAPNPVISKGWRRGWDWGPLVVNFPERTIKFQPFHCQRPFCRFWLFSIDTGKFASIISAGCLRKFRKRGRGHGCPPGHVPHPTLMTTFPSRFCSWDATKCASRALIVKVDPSSGRIFQARINRGTGGAGDEACTGRRRILMGLRAKCHE